MVRFENHIQELKTWYNIILLSQISISAGMAHTGIDRFVWNKLPRNLEDIGLFAAEFEFPVFNNRHITARLLKSWKLVKKLIISSYSIKNCSISPMTFFKKKFENWIFDDNFK